MKKICITGAYGFIGKQICQSLVEKNLSVIGLVRNLNLSKNVNNINYIPVGDIGLNKNLESNLIGVDCIIHCAAKSNVMNESNSNSSKIYHSANVESTKQLAEHAAKAGVKRLIFLSSVKVNGESTDKINIREKFSYNDTPAPFDIYAITKLKAENILWEISSRTGLEVVIIRLPLVYGNDPKGNLAKLVKLVKLGIPLPLSMVKNQRSMIGIDNLKDLLIRCIDHQKANGKTFLVSDGKDLSTPEIIKLIALSMKKKANLFPLPILILKYLGFILGKREEVNKLVKSLKVDNSYTKHVLNWTPPIDIEEGIKRMVQER